MTGVLSSRLIAPFLAGLGGTRLGPELSLDQLLAAGDAEQEILFTTSKGQWNGQTKQTIHGMRRGDLSIQVAPMGAAWGAPGPTPGGDVRFFDVDADPNELVDLAAEQPAEAARLRNELLERVRLLEESSPLRREYRVGEATRELLERLGYAGGS